MSWSFVVGFNPLPNDCLLSQWLICESAIYHIPSTRYSSRYLHSWSLEMVTFFLHNHVEI